MQPLQHITSFHRYQGNFPAQVTSLHQIALQLQTVAPASKRCECFVEAKKKTRRFHRVAPLATKARCSHGLAPWHRHLNMHVSKGHFSSFFNIQSTLNTWMESKRKSMAIRCLNHSSFHYFFSIPGLHPSLQSLWEVVEGCCCDLRRFCVTHVCLTC